MQTVTVTGTRPSDDFVKPNSSLDRIGDLRDTPQSVTIITKSLMQSQGSTSLTSARAQCPGRHDRRRRRQPDRHQHQPQRLLGAHRPLPRRHARRGQYYRDTFALEEIEVLMGPSSMLFGRGSTGGVINQVFKKPTLKPEGGVQRFGDDEWAVPRHGRHQPADQRHFGLPRGRNVPGGRGLDA